MGKHWRVFGLLNHFLKSQRVLVYMADEDETSIHRGSTTPSARALLVNDNPREVMQASAETECAHALLDLARSFSFPASSELSNNSVNSKERTVLYPLSANNSTVTRKITLKRVTIGRPSSPHKIWKGRNSTTIRRISSKDANIEILKRDVKPFVAKKKTFVHGQNPNGDIYPSPSKMLRASVASPSPQDIDKLVRFDHTYAAPPDGEYNNHVNPEFFSLLDEVEGNINVAENVRSSDEDKYEHSPYLIFDPKKNRTEEQTSKLEPSETYSMNFYAERPVGDSSSECVTNDSGEHVDTNIQCDSDSNTSYANNSSDDNHNNFNLLLKCLTTRDSARDRTYSRKRCHSTMVESSLDRNVSGSHEIGSSHEATCEICQKVFSNNSILNKHKLHMHSRDERNMHTTPHFNTVQEKKERKHQVGQSNFYNEKRADIIDDSCSQNLRIAEDLTVKCKNCDMHINKNLINKHEKQCLPYWQHSNESKGQHNRIPRGRVASESGSEVTLSGSEAERSSEDFGFIFKPSVSKPSFVKDVTEVHYGSKFNNRAERSSVDQFSSKKQTEIVSVSSKSGENTITSSSQGLTVASTIISGAPTKDSYREPYGHYMLQRFLQEREKNVPSKPTASFGKAGFAEGSEVTQHDTSKPAEPVLKSSTSVSRTWRYITTPASATNPSQTRGTVHYHSNIPEFVKTAYQALAKPRISSTAN